MKTLDRYLDIAKKKSGSDRQTGLAIGMSAAHMSIARKKGSISNLRCTQLAEYIGVDPLEIIAAAEIKKHPELKGYWAKWIAATVILSVGIFGQGIDFAGDFSAAAFDHAIYYTHCGLVVLVLTLAVMSLNKWGYSRQ